MIVVTFNLCKFNFIFKKIKKKLFYLDSVPHHLYKDSRVLRHNAILLEYKNVYKVQQGPNVLAKDLSFRHVHHALLYDRRIRYLCIVLADHLKMDKLLCLLSKSSTNVRHSWT